jgi:hypothetical protein
MLKSHIKDELSPGPRAMVSEDLEWRDSLFISISPLSSLTSPCQPASSRLSFNPPPVSLCFERILRPNSPICRGLCYHVGRRFSNFEYPRMIPGCLSVQNQRTLFPEPGLSLVKSVLWFFRSNDLFLLILPPHATL